MFQLGLDRHPVFTLALYLVIVIGSVVLMQIAFPTVRGFDHWLLLAPMFAVGVGVYLLKRPYVALMLYTVLVVLIPRARILLGILDIPVYFIDVALGATILVLFLKLVIEGRKHTTRSRVDHLVLWFAILTIPSVATVAINQPGLILEMVYFYGRSLLSILAFFGILWLLINRSRHERFVKVLYYATIFVSLWAILQGIPQTKEMGEAITSFHNEVFHTTSSLSPSPIHGLNRVNAGFNTPNDFSGFIVMMIPLLGFGLLSRSAPKMRIPPAIGISIMFMALVMTYSRTGYIAAIAGIVASGMLSVRWTGISISRYVPGAAFVVVLMSTLIFAFSPNVLAFVGDRVSELSDPLEIRNLQPRLEKTPEFFDAIIENPEILITGQSLRILDLQERGKLPEYDYRGFVSNSWLLIVLDLGLIPWILYVVIFVYALVLLRKSVNRGGAPSYYQGFIVGTFGALVAAGVAHLGDNYFAVMIFMRGLFFMVLAFGMSSVFLNRAEISDESSSPSLDQNPKSTPRLSVESL